MEMLPAIPPGCFSLGEMTMIILLIIAMMLAVRK